METLGNCGRSGRDYTGAESVLAGRLASEYEPKVYPGDICDKCLADGVLESEHCFSRHWNGGKRE